jgi:7,8-dihydropterin-6-yl-methyl-4-(beta-D-ribofuranosyl)aminobenzene 5'-phosphate synthase
VTFRISPWWWPVMAVSAPVLLPMLVARNRRFKQNKQKSITLNQERMRQARPLDLPELQCFQLTVLVEQKSSDGFLSAPAVSYWIKTDQGSLLFDTAYGPESPALAHNAGKLGFTFHNVDALAISHLHPDHMGGFKAVRANQVTWPQELGAPRGKPCFLPVSAAAVGFKPEVIETPRLLAAGIASTGPLARSLFLMGWMEEQAIVARLKDKGLVVITGCGHPTIETVIQMVKRLSSEPIYAIGGGLHFPLTDSPLHKPGLKVQMIWGTGKPPWKRLSDEDLTRTIAQLNTIMPKRVFLSAHDTCDHAIRRLRHEIASHVQVLEAGATYVL